MTSRKSSSSQNGRHRQFDELTHSGNETVTIDYMSQPNMYIIAYHSGLHMAVNLCGLS